MNPALQLCCDLIECPSVTPDDAGCQRIIADRLAAIGFKIVPMPFGSVQNLWAVRDGSGPTLVFAGHTDVVPPGPLERWSSPPFTPTLRDGYLFGRGAADMKASLAAMVVACERFTTNHPDHTGRIGFLITSDEEGPAHDGTVKVIEQLATEGEPIDWCVIGEPSSSCQVGDTIKNGRRGSQGARLTIFGKQGHIAYPHLADNPIHKALAALTALVEQSWDEGNQSFPPTRLQISNIHGGTGATNVIPGELQVDFNLRYSSEITAQDIEERVEALLQEHKIEYAIEWHRSGRPFITEPGLLTEATSSAIFDTCQIRPELSTSGGTSDGRFIAPYGIDVVEIGPVNATIHQINECVAEDAPETLAQIYERIMIRLLTN
jgi:succinyl-diaminopimelate desuccinylase